MCTSHWGESLKCPVIPVTEPLPSFELRFAAMLSGWVCGWGGLSSGLCSFSLAKSEPPGTRRVPVKEVVGGNGLWIGWFGFKKSPSQEGGLLPQGAG